MKKFQALVFILLYNIMLVCAIEKMPPSFTYSSNLIATPQIYEVIFTFNKEILRQQDQENIKNGIPLRIAVGIASDINLHDVSKLSLPNGKKIRQKLVKSEDANGLILFFKELYIPQGAELYIYTQDRSQIKVYTHETNPAGRVYATNILHQDEIVLEYVESTISNEEPRIIVSNIGYVYRSVSATLEDMSCFINVNCEEGQNWQLQKNGVVGISFSIPYRNTRDWYICTASLVNNVRQDKTPFILTAYHCIEGYDGETFSTMIFEFFKEDANTNDCKAQLYESANTKTLSGSELFAEIPVSRGSDAALIKISNPIPEDWNVYYNGWDAEGIAAESGVSIHHPNGMVKKISTFTTTLQPAGRLDFGATQSTAANSHWEVTWSRTINGQSVTYQGSSGSPIYNQNGHIVGTLSGGDSYCDNPNESDYYGRFSYHWDQYSNSNQHFKTYLDPDNIGILVFDGFDPLNLFEQTPLAKEATDITTESFTANWEKSENATKYWLDVYEVVNNEKVYVENYYSRYVGDTTAFNVGSLSPDSEYHYVVRSGKESYISSSSNEISVLTLPLSFDMVSPIATEATFISEQSFVANWKPLTNATSYLLNVYQKENESIEYINGYQNLEIGNVLSYEVTGLEKDMEYFYYIVASNGSILSLPSNEISVVTRLSVSGFEKEELSDYPIIYANNENLVIQLNMIGSTISLYNITGQLITQAKNTGNEIRIPLGSLSKGVYLIKVDSNLYKVLIQ